MTVNYRVPFLPDNIDLTDVEVQSVKRLVRGRDLFSGDIRTNYQSERLVVEPLIIADRFFYELVRISFGESFDNVFVANKSIQPTTNLSAD